MNCLSKSSVAAGVGIGAETGARIGTGAGAEMVLRDGAELREEEALPGKRFCQGEQRGRDSPGAILVNNLIDK